MELHSHRHRYQTAGTRNSGSTSTTRSTSPTQHGLLPTDQGHQAWLTLASAFLGNFLIWGFALAFGVLQEYYTSTRLFPSNTGIAAIGTTTTGAMYLSAPLFLWVFSRWPKARLWSMWASIPCVAVSLIGASFARSVSQLLVCQGIVFALGGNALVLPNVNLINEWFLQKRGLAIGISIAGDFVGGIAFPNLLRTLLDRFGFRWVGLLVRTRQPVH